MRQNGFVCKIYLTLDLGGIQGVCWRRGSGELRQFVDGAVEEDDPVAAFVFGAVESLVGFGDDVGGLGAVFGI